jgi:uncharacterized membrane-anchored protein
VIVGDMDPVTDRALRCGAELLIHGYEGGDAPGAERVENLGLHYEIVPAAGISEDLALLLAYEKGAELIVAVGTHFNMIEFLERNRDGMSSTFLTRLKVGELLIDAKGVSRLVSRQVGVWPLMAFTAAGLGAIVVAFMLAFFSLAQQVQVSATGLDIGRLSLERQRLDDAAADVRSDLNRLGREPAIRKLGIDAGLGQLGEPLVLQPQ